MADGQDLLDVAVFREMADGCGLGLSEFAELYQRSARAEMQALREAIAAGSAAETARLAHGLAGASATAGVTGMVEPLQRIERESDSAEIAELLDRAERQFERVEAALREQSGQAPGS